MNPIPTALAHWYRLNHRQLPWRDTTDPYTIWVSEVILQQTRVDQGLMYFLRFIEKWPDVQSLANASDDDVMKMWQGLGYYTRARNLLSGARQVVDDYGGIVPEEYTELLKIKGIGKYTAAAIASIAFNKPVAVVDGNVARVIARLFAVEQPVNASAGESIIRQAADALLDHSHPGLHNQAMMELGALVCLPRNPKCHSCVLFNYCQARILGMQYTLPAKKPKNAPRLRWFNYFVVKVQTSDSTEAVLLSKRNEEDIWKGMYQFPLIETNYQLTEHELHELAKSTLSDLGGWQPTRIFRAKPHLLSHQRIYATFFELRVQDAVDFKVPKGLSLAGMNQLQQFPFPRLIDIFLNQSYFAKT
jgi:A/G-specific adenine glycosylase